MAKLTILPAARAAELPAIRDRWLAVGLRTGTGDPERAWRGAVGAYEIAGRAAPRWRLWMASPLGALYAAALLKSDQVSDQVRDQVRAQVRDQVLDQVRDQVSDQVSAQVLDQVLAQVRDQVLDQVRDQVRDQVLDQVRDQVLAQVRDQVRAQVRDQVRDQVLDQVRAQVRAQVLDQVRDLRFGWWWMPGQFDSWWISFYDALREYCDFSRLRGLIDIAESCSFALTFPDIVIFVAPPVAIHRDDEGRLHCEDGAAVAFADGWGVYAIHGVRLDSWIVEHPERITAEAITEESNAEVRRIMLSRFGEARYIEALGAAPIDASDFGTLYQVLTRDDEPLTLVRVTNATPEADGTFKDYWLRVHPECRPMLDGGQYGEPQELTALNAVASTFGMTGGQYLVGAAS